MIIFIPPSNKNGISLGDLSGKSGTILLVSIALVLVLMAINGIGMVVIQNAANRLKLTGYMLLAEIGILVIGGILSCIYVEKDDDIK